MGATNQDGNNAVLSSEGQVTTEDNGLAWFNADWSNRKKITIDNAKVTAYLTNFPVLVNFTSDTDLAADAQNDGDDILFTFSNGTTKLSNEIEKFDGTTGELVAWIKIPSVS